MQLQLRENNSDIDQDNDDDNTNKLKHLFKKHLISSTVNFGVRRKVPTLPKTCVAAAWRTEQDVINASTEQLDSRCKVCKPCHRIEKLINASTLFKTKIVRGNSSGRYSTSEAPENGLEREGETENGEMGIENRTAAGEKDDGYLRFDVPSGHSNVTMKVRAPVIYGKTILGVNCENSGESSKNKQIQLRGKEHVLDKLIDTLNISQNVNSEGPNVKSEIQSDNPVGRRISISSNSTETSSDSDTEQEKTHRVRSERKNLKYQKVVATRRRLAEAKGKQDRIRQEKERDIRRIEKRKKDDSSLVEEQISRLNERFEEMQKEKAKEIARLKENITVEVRAKMEADRRMCEEVDTMAKTLENEKDAKNMNPRHLDEPGTSESATEGGSLVDAPVFFPTRDEFEVSIF